MWKKKDVCLKSTVGGRGESIEEVFDSKEVKKEVED
jgi:hypothetical protein